jgi:site-specific DNA-methyltransferase (adenine-specific)
MEGSPVQIDEATYKRMPPHLQMLFSRDPNPAKAEVIEAFPSAPGQIAKAAAGGERRKTQNVYGEMVRGSNGQNPRGDSGSAARFFYSAKAAKEDRAGSKHPTIKPIALLQWLTRLVTPPGGVVLDPFAGSGTTGAAALKAGLRCLMIEREAEYVEDIRRRFAAISR